MGGCLKCENKALAGAGTDLGNIIFRAVIAGDILEIFAHHTVQMLKELTWYEEGFVKYLIHPSICYLTKQKREHKTIHYF